MSKLNYEFFMEFGALESLCRQIYPLSPDKELAVTLYMKDMEDKAYLGGFKVPNWTEDYKKLRRARDIRNEIAHPRNPISYDLCAPEDIDFVCSFRGRILNQTDPLALLRQQTTLSSQSRHERSLHSTGNITPQAPTGCLGIVAAGMLIAVCIILLFIL